MRKQNKEDRLRRLREGYCPIHGISMVQVEPCDNGVTFVMGCPRRDCNIQAFEIDKEDFSIRSIILSPEFEYLLDE